MVERMSISEASSALGISVPAVHKRIKSGTLSATKVNGRWLVDARSVKESKLHPPQAGRPRSGESYVLMNGTHEVMEFTYRSETGRFSPGAVMDPARAPIGTVSRSGKGSAEGLKSWWEHRSIPESREGMDARLRRLGLEDPSQVPFRNLGFSLSDQYWVRPDGSPLKWADLNYFDNPFGQDVDGWDGWLSQVGLSSPDNTSEGVLPKRWACMGDKRVLLKGHVPWTDQQVYNEVVATALFRRVLNPDDYVPYEVARVDGLGVASRCGCFLESFEEYVPMSALVDSEGRRQGETAYDTVIRVCRNLGISEMEAETRLSKMIVCDGILANTDRHLRNFGLIRDVEDLTWRFAPLFDTGNSLWFDKDEGQVAEGDHSFASRPFDASPNRQLLYAADTYWLDMDRLEGFVDEACEILSEGNLSRWRVDYLREGIQQRIDAIRLIL